MNYVANEAAETRVHHTKKSYDFFTGTLLGPVNLAWHTANLFYYTRNKTTRMLP